MKTKEGDKWYYVGMCNGLFLELIYLKFRETKTKKQMLSSSVINEITDIKLNRSKHNTPRNRNGWKKMTRDYFRTYIENGQTFKEFVDKYEIPDRFLRKLK